MVPIHSAPSTTPTRVRPPTAMPSSAVAVTWRASASTRHRPPSSWTPQAAMATTGAVWVLADDSVVRVDPQSNRQVAADAVTDAVEGLADNGHPWAWGAGVATRLDGDVKVRIPADATDVAASDDALFSLVGDDVVRSPLPAD